MKRIFQLFILIFILHSCDNKFDNVIDNSSYKIHYNNNWSVEKSEIDNVEFYLIGNDSLNKFCNINLNIQNYTENRSEEHTSELQSRPHLVCRLLLEKKK